MNFHRLTELIEQGEGLSIEFKRKVSTPEKIAREMIAFANTAGGVIIFGVDDDRSIVGVESEKAEINAIVDAAQTLIQPQIAIDISIFGFEEKDVVCVEIPESRSKPHFLAGGSQPAGEEPKAFIRVGENSVTASREMVKILRYRSGAEKPVRLIIGEAERRLFDFLERNERISVKEYADLINVSDRRASRLLIRLVKAGVLAIHSTEKQDFYTMMQDLR